MGDSVKSDDLFYRNSQVASSSENTELSNSSSASTKRHSKTRSRVWEKVAWFTRKTKTIKDSKRDSPGERKSVWKSPSLRRPKCNKAQSKCHGATEQFAISCPNSSPNFAKNKTKSGLKKARSFNYLKRKKSGHYSVKAESINREEGTKENDHPRCQTATGTFYDFQSTGRRNSRSTSCCSVLNEMAKEINFGKGGEVKESTKSSLSLPMSLLYIGETSANELHSAACIRQPRGRIGPMYNSWPRKKRNFRSNHYAEALCPPLKQKRMCRLRKRATFSGFDANCHLGADLDSLKAIKSSPVLDIRQNQIKNQNGLPIGVIHFSKSPTGFEPSFSDSVIDPSSTSKEIRSSVNDSDSTKQENLPDSRSGTDFNEIDLGDGIDSQCSQAHPDVCDFLEVNEKWKVEQESPVSVADCTNTQSDMSLKDLKLSFEDSRTCLETTSQGEHSAVLSLVPSPKLSRTEYQQLEVIREIPDNLSGLAVDNECSPNSDTISKDLNPQNDLTSGNQVHQIDSLDSSIYCININDQSTDFSESKHDSPSNLKQMSTSIISTFCEADEKLICKHLKIQNTTIKDAEDVSESSTPLVDCKIVESQELKDIVLGDSSLLSPSKNTACTTPGEEEDTIKLGGALVLEKSDEESLASSSSQLDSTDSCLRFDVTSVQLSSQSVLKEKQVKVDGIEFKHQSETMLKWFSEFNDEQRNIFIRRVLGQCELPQMHMLSVIMEPILHNTCPSNCQDMLAWLPLTVIETILSFLDPVSLCRSGQVNRIWNSLVSRPLIWKKLCRSNEWQLSRTSGKIQYSKYTLPCGTVQWKKMLAERFLLRSNWLNGRCKMRTYEDHTQGISCVQFDDTRIVSGSSDKTIKVWDLSRDDSHAVLTLAGHSGTVRCLNLNGNRLVSGSVDRSIKVWDLSFESYWSGASCKVTMVGHMHTVRCLQVDDEKVVSGSYDKTLKVWDIKTGQCKLTLRGHNAAVLCAQFDDSKIVSGSYDNTIKVWSLKEGECLMTLTGHHDAVTCLNLTQDGRKVISGSLDHNLKFWDLATGKCIGTLDWIRSEGHTGVIRCLQSDSWRIVSAGDDKTLKMWSLETGQRLLTLRCHTDGVTCLQFNDYRIVSGSYDKTVKVWDFTPEHEFLNPS